MDGDSTHLRTKSMFERCERKTRVMFEKKALQCIVHMPSGENEFQPSLVRGSGVWSRKVSLYNKPWRRLTVEKMLGMMQRGLPFYIKLCRKGPFAEIWVMPKQTASDTNEMRMRQFAELWFAEDPSVADRHYPCNAVGRKSLGALRQMMAKYEIVGRRRDNTFQALLRDGCIKGTTEHALLCRHLFSKVDLGILHGVPRSLAQSARQKAVSKKAKAQRRIGRLLYDECEESTGDEADVPAEVPDPGAESKVVVDGVVAVEGGLLSSPPLVLGPFTAGAERNVDKHVEPELGYGDEDGSGSELSFSDPGSDVDRGPGRWDSEIDEFAKRIFECERCGRNHFVPPMYEAIYKASGRMKFVCKRIPGQECRPGLAPRARGGRGKRRRTAESPGSVNLDKKANAETDDVNAAPVAELRVPQGDRSVGVGKHVPLAPAFAGRFPAKAQDLSGSQRGARPDGPHHQRENSDSSAGRGRASLQGHVLAEPSKLKNLGRTCFANSLAQVLRRSFGDRFAGSPQSCPLVLMLSPHVLPEDWGLWRAFHVGEQQDAVEVFEALVDPDHPMHDACGPECCAQTIRQLFEFSMQDSQRCLSCEHRRDEDKTEVVVRMSASLQPGVRPTFQVGLRLLQDWSPVAGFVCSACGEQKGSLNQQVCRSSPPFLVVKAEKEAGVFKKGIPVEVDVLHIGERYMLQGVIHHDGATPCAGHYTATVVGDGPPFFCDDRLVRPRRNVHQLVRDGYAAVYKRVQAEGVPIDVEVLD